MTISPAMQSLIGTSIWDDDRPRPVLKPRVNVDEVAPAPFEVVGPRSKGKAPVSRAMKPKTAGWTPSPELSRVILEKLRALGPVGAYDVFRALRKDGIVVGDHNVARTLEHLVQRRKAKRTDLRLQRDIDRAGCRALFEVRS